MGIAVINILLTPVAVILNGLTLYTIYRCRRLHTVSNYILCSLALNDLLSGCITQPLFAALILNMTHCGARCHLYVISTMCGYFLSSISFLSLFLISMDRYLSIFYPYTYQKITANKSAAIRVIGATWIFCLVVVVASWFTPQLAIHTYMATVLIPVIFLWSFFVHTRTLCLVRRINREVVALRRITRNARGSITNDNDHGQMTSRATKVAAMILIAMFVTYIPHNIFAVMRNYVQLTEFEHDVFLWAVTLVLLNSTLNPLIYCWQLKELRNKILATICCLKQLRIVKAYSENHAAPWSTS